MNTSGCTSRKGKAAGWLAAGAIALGAAHVVSADDAGPIETVRESVSSWFSDDVEVSVTQGHLVNLMDHIVLDEEHLKRMSADAAVIDGPVGLRTEDGGLYLLAGDHFRKVQLDRVKLDKDQLRDTAAKDAGREPADRDDADERREPLTAEEKQEVRHEAVDAGLERKEETLDKRLNRELERKQAAADDEAEDQPAAADRRTTGPEHELDKAVREAQAKVDGRYEKQVDSADKLDQGDAVAIVGRVYERGGLQAILVHSIHVDGDAPAAQARVE